MKKYSQNCDKTKNLPFYLTEGKKKEGTMEDKEIIKLFQARDETALVQLDIKYGRYCRTIAGNILFNPADAEECVNDVFLKVWEAIPPAAPKYLSPFLAKITRNAALDRYDMNRRKKRGSGEAFLPFEELEDMLSDSGSVEESAENKELVAAISAFLSKQPKKKRLLFLGRYWYCYTMTQLAESFGMTEHNVSVSLGRIREKLKEYLKKRGFEI